MENILSMRYYITSFQCIRLHEDQKMLFNNCRPHYIEIAIYELDTQNGMELAGQLIYCKDSEMLCGVLIILTIILYTWFIWW